MRRIGSPRALRIAHLTATFPPYTGGAGNTAFRLARDQAARGHAVEVFTAPADGKAPDPGGAVVHRIKPVFAIGNAPLLPSLARLGGFDVVHLQYPFIFGSELVLLGRGSSRRRRAQALVVQYQNRLKGPGPRGALFEIYERTVARALIRVADRICVLSADHAASVPYLRRMREREPETLVEVPNGVDTEAFSPGADASGLRERLGITVDAVVAGFVALLDHAHRFKRLDVAIEALAKLRGDETPGEGADVHLVVAGGGDLLDGFRDQARTAGVGDRVHFLGTVPHAELPDVLRACDLFLLTTEPPESFGTVLAEAMACGLPTIATDYPGVRTVVDDGETGIVVPLGDSGAVASAVRSLVAAGRAGRQRLGAKARAKAERTWSWSQLEDRLDRVYDEAIEVRQAKLRGRR